jgi:hypothetical protein
MGAEVNIGQESRAASVKETQTASQAIASTQVSE